MVAASALDKRSVHLLLVLGAPYLTLGSLSTRGVVEVEAVILVTLQMRCEKNEYLKYETQRNQTHGQNAGVPSVIRSTKKNFLGLNALGSIGRKTTHKRHNSTQQTKAARGPAVQARTIGQRYCVVWEPVASVRIMRDMRSAARSRRSSRLASGASSSWKKSPRR